MALIQYITVHLLLVATMLTVATVVGVDSNKAQTIKHLKAV